MSRGARSGTGSASERDTRRARTAVDGARPTTDLAGTVVNDVHSRLNATHVHRVVRPESVEAIRDAVLAARREGRAVSVAG